MPDDVKNIFVSNLNYLMQLRGKTQADIAHNLDVSTATASDWCNGKKYPRIDKMQLLADYLGVGLSALITTDGLSNIADQDRLEALHKNPRLGMLFDRSARMSQEDVEFMIQMAGRILKERDS